MTKPSTIAEIRRQLQRLERQLYEASRADKQTGKTDRAWRLATAADMITSIRGAELWRLR